MIAAREYASAQEMVANYRRIVRARLPKRPCRKAVAVEPERPRILAKFRHGMSLCIVFEGQSEPFWVECFDPESVKVEPVQAPVWQDGDLPVALASKPKIGRSFVEIVRHVCGLYGVACSEAFVRRRTAFASLIRGHIVYLAKQETALSYPDIGRRLGGFDHTTMMHARGRFVRVCEAVRTGNPIDDQSWPIQSAALQRAVANGLDLEAVA
jgi:hypothetical protein